MAIDSLDWLERLIWDAVCRRESATTIEKVGGGYGKGYTLALDYWRRLIDNLGVLHRDRGMMVFLIAHAKVEKFEDPEAPAYDRYSPRLHKHARDGTDSVDSFKKYGPASKVSLGIPTPKLRLPRSTTRSQSKTT